MREFDSGATRDDADGKLDFEGALSPAVLWEFASYMEQHGHLADGSTRTSDNWQKGIPQDELMKSLIRHIMDLWLLHRGYTVTRPEDGKPVDWHGALGGAFFNLQGYWLGLLKGEGNGEEDSATDQSGVQVPEGA